MAGGLMLLYGVTIRDILARGDLEQMRAVASISSMLISSSDLEGDEATDLKKAHQELMTALGERDRIEISTDDVIAIKDGIVVIDSIQLAKRLKLAMASDVEDTFISLITIVIK
jgi:hypothetical protein